MQLSKNLFKIPFLLNGKMCYSYRAQKIFLIVMSLPPQKFREILFQLLYSQDFTSLEPLESIPFMMQELKVTRRTMVDAHLKIEKICEKLELIDELIKTFSKNYSLDRISNVEKTILRLGIYELLYDENLPYKIIISEAVRLCRKFGTRESANFVNAILDAIYQHSNQSATV